MVNVNLFFDMEMVARVVIALLLGCLVGWERERHGISAGIRTYGAIALGACVFGVVSESVIGGDPTRIAAQVATGIGFLGAGVIFRQENHISGLTTAATLWATAAIGLAIAFGMYFIGALTAIFIGLLLYLPRLKWWSRISGKKKSNDHF